MLRCEGLSYRHLHSPIRALDGLNLELPQGRTLLVGGHSGSGKSTLLSVLAGLMPHYYKGELNGRVSLDGREPGRMSLAEWGSMAAMMMQNPETQFLAATVEEELLMTLRCRGLSSGEAARRAAERMELFGLGGLRNHSVFNLSEGQKQKVVLAALTALKPRLLLLDEPSANLDPDSALDLKNVLAGLKEEGLSLVIADHRLSWLDGLCDQVLILENGRPACQGDWDLLKDDALRERLHLRDITPARFEAAGQAESSEGSGTGLKVLVEEVCFAYPDGPELFGGLNASLEGGRVTALTGPSGRGKTTLARLICGLEKPSAGRIRLDGASNGCDSRRWGQVVLQNADHQLYMSTVGQELDLALGGGRRIKKKDDSSANVLTQFGLDHLQKRHPQSLSGGEKQRLVVAVGMAAPTNLMALDEPTSGLDGRNLKLMAAQIKKAAARGPAVLVITHDLELARLCADRHLTIN
ncbi:ABC transporter [Deltaproteobacteria bacterium Smac51]|nr:ABC transporter [Deltaproteobacteria bacterium Smac51]